MYLPTIASKTLVNLLDSLSVLSKNKIISVELLESTLQCPRRSATGAFSTLNLLGLVDTEGFPTDDWQVYLHSPSRILRPKLKEIYPELFGKYQNPADMPLPAIRDAIRSTNAGRSKDWAKRAARCYLDLFSKMQSAEASEENEPKSTSLDMRSNANSNSVKISIAIEGPEHYVNAVLRRFGDV